MIDDQSVSVIVQGPIIGKPSAPPSQQLTKRVLESVRRHLPKAEIILSSWQGSNTEGLDFDQSILSEDPGAFQHDVPPGETLSNNVNRMIASTSNGLKAATRKMSLKLRTDCELTSNRILDWHGKFESYDHEVKYFNSRVVSLTVYSRDPGFPQTIFCMNKWYQLPHHPSDIAQFGETVDLQNLWDIPLIQDDEQKYSRPASRKLRYFSEQYVWLSFLRKHADVDYLSKDIIASRRQMDESHRLFANNLVLITPRQFGLRSLQKRLFVHARPETCYTHRQWLRMYYLYSGGRPDFWNLFPDCRKLWNRVVAYRKEFIQSFYERPNLIKRFELLEEKIEELYQKQLNDDK